MPYYANSRSDILPKVHGVPSSSSVAEPIRGIMKFYVEVAPTNDDSSRAAVRAPIA